MFRIVLLLISLIFCGNLLPAQTCDCAVTAKALVEGIENNYIDFEYKIKNIGERKYKRIRRVAMKKASKVLTDYNCFLILRNYLSVFREPHISIGFSAFPENQNTIKAIFSALKKIKPSKYINTDNNRTGIEGVWESLYGNYYRIRIIKQGRKSYKGIIDSADNLFWFPGQQKFDLKVSGEDAGSAVFSSRDHMKEPVKWQLEKTPGLILNFGKFGYYKRAGDSSVNNNLISYTIAPSYKKLSDSTGYLRLPSFANNTKLLIDSILQINFTHITQQPFLIIDLRNNGGGFSSSFENILPVVYKYPIIKPAFNFRASEENIQLHIEYVSRFSDTAAVRRAALQLQSEKGRTITLIEADTIQLPSYTHPRKIILLVNNNTASAAEDFILKAKKSGKTEVAGTHTRGAFDNRDIYRQRKLPCSLFTYVCPTGQSENTPRIDNTGIRPDIDLEMQRDEHWIGYVRTLLEKDSK